ncbi:MAG: PAS domain-containing protein [Actinomycetota bacterium]|nr:PAS domain-containing protein [Actinomycetota bacterium]
MTSKETNKKVTKKAVKSNSINNKNNNNFFSNNEQSDLFQNLINNIPDHIYIKDTNSRFIMVNKTKASFSGKKPSDFIGKTDFDFFPENESEIYFNDEKRIMETGIPVIDKVEKLVYNGNEYWMSSSKIPWFDKNGNIMGIMGISRDITERKNLEDELLGREKNFFNALMDNITESIFFKDTKSRFVRINKACAKKFGIDKPEEAIGKTDFDFFSEEHASQAYRDEQYVIKSGKAIIDLEEKETYENKADRWASTSKIPWRDDNGNIIGIFGITRDITEKKKAEEKIEYLSFHDVLTGLYNRAFFEEELKRLNTDRQLPLTIVMGDVNGLKLINDAYGHIKGDEFLVEIADILKDSFRKEDILSRWGGDEFIAILPKTTTRDAQKVVKRIKDSCKKRATTEMPLSISLGVATKKKPEEDIEEVIKKAEDKMYKNKLLESKSINEQLVESLKENLRKGELDSEEHSLKLREYALLIGERLGLSNIKLEELKLLIDVYNIGKLALADEIMAKPGRLTNKEWELVKKLPEYGYRIAESSEKLKPIAEAILSHYEWYNGSGYPRGIKGEEIPLLSRISFVINSYDAMTKNRPYRKKMTKSEIIKEFKKFSGTQFDPEVVNIFLSLLEKDLER